MFNKAILFIIIIFYSNYVFPQTSPTQAKVPAPVVNRNPENFSDQVTIIDPSTGKAFKNNLEAANPEFFLGEWRYCLIKLVDGRVMDMTLALLNLTNSNLYFKMAENIEMFFPGGMVKELDIYDTREAKKIIYKFKTGFPKIDNQDQNTYYQIISEGNASLLKSIIKKVSINKNELSGETEKQLIVYENYFVFSNNQMRRLKKDKTFILKALDDKKEKIEEFAKQHSTDYKNIDDITTLFNFYNSLFSL